MKRSELEHIIRASGAIASEREIIVIGSQAVLGQYPNAPTVLLASMEADVYPRTHPELGELIDGSIGEGSFFHEQFGYYAQGVGPNTAILPRGWEFRLVRVENENTGGITGLCLEVHDLAISKYVAGRPKDAEFTHELARHGLTKRVTLIARLAQTTTSAAVQRLVRGRIQRDFASRPRSKRASQPQRMKPPRFRSD